MAISSSSGKNERDCAQQYNEDIRGIGIVLARRRNERRRGQKIK